MNSQRLENELAIVTGSDSGIGRATAIAFAREGADVVVTYFHDRKGAEHTAAQVEGIGRKTAVFQLDQRDPDNVARLFRQVHAQIGVPTVLVNNAGINAAGTHVKDMSNEEWDNVIRTNLHGPFYACREFIRGLDGSGRHGSIINITSVHQEIPRAGAAGYDASKGGLRNLTTTLALELAEKNINVNNIAPGMVLTPMNQAAVDDPDEAGCKSGRNSACRGIPGVRSGPLHTRHHHSRGWRADAVSGPGRVAHARRPKHRLACARRPVPMLGFARQSGVRRKGIMGCIGRRRVQLCAFAQVFGCVAGGRPTRFRLRRFLSAVSLLRRAPCRRIQQFDHFCIGGL